MIKEGETFIANVGNSKFLVKIISPWNEEDKHNISFLAEVLTDTKQLPVTKTFMVFKHELEEINCSEEHLQILSLGKKE